MKLLERSGIAHRVITYEHDPAAESYGTEASDALGVSPDDVFKTLIAAITGTGSGPGHVIGIIAVSDRLDLKAIAAAAGAKKAAMAERVDAERLTGYVLGGISPLGQKKRLAGFVDEAARSKDLVYVSGGRRGLEIELAPTDLVTALGGRFAPIATR